MRKKKSIGKEKKTPFALAFEGDAEKLKKHLKERDKASIAPEVSGDFKGFTPLAVAIRMGHINVVQLFIDYKYNLKSALQKGECEGFSPVIVAIYYGQLEILKLLVQGGLDCGAPLSFEKHKNQTPLSIAVRMQELSLRNNEEEAHQQDRVKIIEFLVSCGVAFDAPVKAEGWLESSVEQYVADIELKPVTQIIENERKKMKEHLEQFTDFLDYTLSTQHEWEIHDNGFHYLWVNCDSKDFDLFSVFLKSNRVEFKKYADEKILHIAKKEIYNLIEEFDVMQIEWINTLEELKFVTEIKPSLQEVFGQDQVTFDEDYLTLFCSLRTFFIAKDLFKKSKPVLINGEPFDDLSSKIEERNCFRILRENVVHEKSDQFLELVNEVKVKKEKFKKFLKLASDCGNCNFQDTLAGLTIRFENPKRASQFSELIKNYFKDEMTYYPYEKILSLEEKGFTKMCAEAESFKKRSLGINENKIQQFKEIINCLIFKLDDFNNDEFTLCAINVKPKCMAVFSRINPILRCDLLLDAHQVIFDKEYLSSLTELELSNIKSQANLNLNKIHRFINAIRWTWKETKQDCYTKEGLEFSCELGNDAILQEICGEILKKNKDNSNSFLIPYKNVFDLKEENIAEIGKILKEKQTAAEGAQKSPEFQKRLPRIRDGSKLNHNTKQSKNKLNTKKQQSASQKTEAIPEPKGNKPLLNQVPKNNNIQSIISPDVTIIDQIGVPFVTKAEGRKLQREAEKARQQPKKVILDFSKGSNDLTGSSANSGAEISATSVSVLNKGVTPLRGERSKLVHNTTQSKNPLNAIKQKSVAHQADTISKPKNKKPLLNRVAKNNLQSIISPEIPIIDQIGVPFVTKAEGHKFLQKKEIVTQEPKKDILDFFQGVPALAGTPNNDLSGSTANSVAEITAPSVSVPKLDFPEESNDLSGSTANSVAEITAPSVSVPKLDFPEESNDLSGSTANSVAEITAPSVSVLDKGVCSPSTCEYADHSDTQVLPFKSLPLTTIFSSLVRAQIKLVAAYYRGMLDGPDSMENNFEKLKNCIKELVKLRACYFESTSLDDDLKRFLDDSWECLNLSFRNYWFLVVCAQNLTKEPDLPFPLSPRISPRFFGNSLDNCDHLGERLFEDEALKP